LLKHDLHCHMILWLKDHSLLDLEASFLCTVRGSFEGKDLSMDVGPHGTFQPDLLEYHVLIAH
jgi:hypothetical protein